MLNVVIVFTGYHPLVAVPQEAVATESSSMASRADVVVDAAGHGRT